MIGIDKASSEIIEQECQALEEDLAHIEDQIRTYQDGLRHIERKAARAGGEDYLSVADKNQLDSIQRCLEEKKLERQEIRYNLDDKRVELQGSRDVEILGRQLERAMEQKQLEKAIKIASRIKTLEASLAATVNSELVRLHWQMVIENPGEDYTTSRKAWEKLETICYEIGDDTGLKNARRGLASLFEERGEEKEDQEEFRSAAHFYRRALDKYESSGKLFDQQRVLDKLILVHKNIGDLEAALRYSSARTELLGQLGRPREAEHCYFQALDTCSYLPEARQIYWENKLSKLVIDHLDRLSDIAGLERIENYSIQNDKQGIRQLVTPILETVVERLEQPLRIAA